MQEKAKREAPAFSSEMEEAQWWDNQRERISQDFAEAARAGALKVTTRDSLRERLKTRSITIRLPERDLDLARTQADRKGLPYQTYIRSLLHETLMDREALQPGR